MAGGWFDRFLAFFGFEQVIEEEADLGGAATDQGEETAASPRPRRGNVLNFPARGNLRVMVVHPTSFVEVQGIADYLKEGHPVAVNLEEVDKEEAQHLLNFLSGTVYAINGDMQRLGNNILLFAPRSVVIMAEGTSTALTETEGRSPATPNR